MPNSANRSIQVPFLAVAPLASSAPAAVLTIRRSLKRAVDCTCRHRVTLRALSCALKCGNDSGRSRVNAGWPSSCRPPTFWKPAGPGGGNITGLAFASHSPLCLPRFVSATNDSDNPAMSWIWRENLPSAMVTVANATSLIRMRSATAWRGHGSASEQRDSNSEGRPRRASRTQRVPWRVMRY